MTNKIIVVLGKKGSGKTYLVQNKILRLFPKMPKFIIDPLHEYSDGMIFESATDLLRSYSQKDNESNNYILRSRSVDDIPNLLSALSKLKEEVVLVVEEVDQICNPSFIQPDLNWLIQYGRHVPINMIFLARRASSINRNTTAQSDTIVSFKQTEPRDVKTLTERSEAFSKVSELGEYKYIVDGDSLKK